MRNSFVFYNSWWEAVKNLPRDVQGDVLTAIIEYGLTGATTGQLKPIAKAMLAMAKGQIDINNQRFENGKKGGRCKQDRNQTETKVEPNRNQTETKVEPNVNDNVNENVNENDEYIPPVVPQGDETGSSKSEELRIEYTSLMDTFNSMFDGKLPKVTSMTDKRKRSVKARAAEHGKNAIMTVFQNVLASPFLLGHNDKNWSCDFDWIFRSTNFIKILEGNYNGKPSHKVQQGGAYTAGEAAQDKAASRQSLEDLADAILGQP